MADYLYPTNVELERVAQELVPELIRKRPIFNIFPIRSLNSHLLEWEQKDNVMGLQQVRGLNGEPLKVSPISGKRYAETPGVYGEYMLLDELALTVRRPYGSFGGPIDVSDLILENQNKLLGRRLDRIEAICWTLLSTGTFSVASQNTVMHVGSYTLQTFAAGVPWATVATATPLANFRSMQLLGRGLSVDFGSSANVYMNRTTFNSFLSNTNANDFGGRRLAGLMPVNGPQQLNELMSLDGLPNIIVYDQGYLDETGTFQLFIPNNKAIVVGARTDNDPIGNYLFTRNANNPGLEPGPYMRVIDEPNQIPRTIVVHDGHNGGPVLFHPASIVIATV